MSARPDARTDARMKAATLAVGTEVVDGQITDRNSAWISDRCVAAGLEVFEHRAVPDDRELISRALRELSERTDLLFVTGGLGPTSDDFTRDLISEVYKAPLEFNEASWQKIVKRFEARGATAKPIQRQQCFFPRGASILDNPIGTANAFSMPVMSDGGRKVFVVVLPGPPAEIAAVWEAHLAAKLASLVPSAEQEDLHVWQTLGLGEGDIAEKVEAAIAGSGLRVGYRVHLPYVEVKLWVRRAQSATASAAVDRVEKALSEWIVTRGKDDLCHSVIRAVYKGANIAVLDRVTGGYAMSRLVESLAAYRKLNAGVEPKGSLRVTTSLVAHESGPEDLKGDAILLSMAPDPAHHKWIVKITGPESQTLAVEPTPLYNFGTERGQKYMVEKMFHVLSGLPPFAATSDSPVR